MSDGKPLSGAEIVFQPIGDEGGRPSRAVTDQNGLFELKYDEELTGAKVGVHGVNVTIYGERGPAEVEGQPGPPLKPPKQVSLGEMIVPKEGLESLKLDVKQSRS